MSLFSFIKNAGENLFNFDSEPSVDEKVKIENSLREKLELLDLKISDLSLKLNGNTVSLGGVVGTQTIKEKIILVLGNTAGISKVEDNIIVEIEEPASQLHTVVKGETLSFISKKYYKNPMKYNIIFDANKPMLKDPDLIYPGQVLRVPQIC